MRSTKAGRVLVIAPGATSRGGIVSVVRLHTELSVWKRWQCTLLSTFRDGSRLTRGWAAVSAYAQAPFRMATADIVHVHLAGQSSLIRKLPFALLARALRKPLIVHVHASSPESLFEGTPKWALRSVMASADRAIALSASWADLLREHLPKACVQVIPNPVRVSEHAPVVREAAVLFAGKLEVRKGYGVLLEAAKSILSARPEVKFWFAGHGEVQEARAQAELLGILPSVEFLGWLPQEELRGRYRRASVFCLPSQNEGVPMSVLEAMSLGTPVVCTPVGGLPEIIKDGQNGIFAQVDDTMSTAAGIMRLLEDPALASRCAEHARQAVSAWCSAEIVDGLLEDLYTSLLPSRTLESGRQRAEADSFHPV